MSGGAVTLHTFLSCDELIDLTLNMIDIIICLVYQLY